MTFDNTKSTEGFAITTTSDVHASRRLSVGFQPLQRSDSLVNLEPQNSEEQLSVQQQQQPPVASTTTVVTTMMASGAAAPTSCRTLAAPPANTARASPRLDPDADI